MRTYLLILYFNSTWIHCILFLQIYVRYFNDTIDVISVVNTCSKLINFGFKKWLVKKKKGKTVEDSREWSQAAHHGNKQVTQRFSPWESEANFLSHSQYNWQMYLSAISVLMQSSISLLASASSRLSTTVILNHHSIKCTFNQILNICKKKMAIRSPRNEPVYFSSLIGI